MKPQEIRAEIQAGRSVINREPGNSMLPRLRSRQACLLEPVNREIQAGDIVFAKVKGRHYTHYVTAVGSDGRYQIGNAHGHINGWTRDIIALATPLSESEVKRLKVQRGEGS